MPIGAWVVAVAWAGNPPDSLVLPAADVVVRGQVERVEPADRSRQWALARALSFDVLLPGAVLPQVCLRVDEALYGGYIGERACFYRVSGLSLGTEDLQGTGDQIVGRQAVFLLREAEDAAGALYAADREALQPEDLASAVSARVSATRGGASLAAPAVPGRPAVVDVKAAADLLAVHDLAAVPTLRQVLRDGTPDERVAVFSVVAEFGVLPLVPDLVDHVDDGDRVTSDLDPIGLPVGASAVRALLLLGARLDGRSEKDRPIDVYGFMPGAIDFDARKAAVEASWADWWADWKARGPR